jgi:CRISPR-associated endonuclease Csn1
MGKILGLDLGTNSIGWAIRNTELENGTQIIDKGVVVFKKGVGDGKSGEFSLAAERRKNRSKRRLYNAKRYRKWELLKVLIANNMCPLSTDELNLWRVGNWIEANGEKKNMGRQYPTSRDFFAWLAMDFERIGQNNGDQQKIRPAFRNPYELRQHLLENVNADGRLRNYKIGRAMYHLVQRRGFKSSRKSGKSAYGENDYFKKQREEHPEWKSSQIWLNGLTNENRRIRASGIIQRSEYENEFKELCRKQNLSESLTKQLFKAIYYVRPLRTQKGLVGKCTLEKSKPRMPVSHPFFEEFRALQFINNIKYRRANSHEQFEAIPLDWKKRILERFFFRRSKSHFRFEEIINHCSNNGEFEFNYKHNASVSGCPVTAALIDIFNDSWTNKFLQEVDKFGVNWDGLTLVYSTMQYGVEKQVTLDVEGIWHLLFDYLQTKDKEEELINFALERFGWDDEKAKKFASVDIRQGYGSLSRKAIFNLLPYLRKGFIYSEAVLFANLKKVLGENMFNERGDEVINSIRETIVRVNLEKQKLNVINSLIQDYFSGERQANDGLNFESKLSSYYGSERWNKFTDEQKQEYIDFVSTKFTRFENGNQDDNEKASFRANNNPARDYYKLPRLDEAITEMLRSNYGASERNLKLLYHPSDIDMYPTVPRNNGHLLQLGNPQPPTRGWKNPMAMRTMYELRKLLNYLLKVGKIDENTRIVLEMSRELNDANYRKAYTDWIKDRENENNEYASAIAEMFTRAETQDDDFNKLRLAVEQIKEFSFAEGKSGEFTEKYEKFIDDYLKRTENNAEENHFDYLMYLILNRDEFARMLNFQPPNSDKWITQIIKTSKKFRENRKALKEMLARYRLWREQKFQCLYTGNVISFTDLFDGTKVQIEHTIPRSISFDTELKNLTVCDAVYNNNVKQKQFPTQCPNYDNEVGCQTIEGEKNCTPIRERVNRLIKPRVEELESRIKNLQSIAKSIPDWETDRRNANIRLRHYLRFELDYWKAKLHTFTVTPDQWEDKFKNSQLIDTQIITRYARAYLKSLFNYVYVQKGVVTSVFRDIYGLPPKVRENHSHHAVDAAVLTLIPGSATRDKQLKEFFEWQEGTRRNYQRPKPYDSFQTRHIKNDIENNILVVHVNRDRALIPTYKFARKRGEIVFLKDKQTGQYLTDAEGNRIPKLLRGRSIRGRLHKETFLGAIKVVERDELGKPKRDAEGKLICRKDTNGNEIWVVNRIPIKDLDIKKDEIIDEQLKRKIEQQLNEGTKLTELVDFQGNRIRHVRCRYKAGRGFLSREKAIELKRHSHLSKYPHKQYILAQNEDGYIYLLYEGTDNQNRLLRKARILSLFDFQEYGFSSTADIVNDTALKYFTTLPLKTVLRVGQKVIFYAQNREELKNISLRRIVA